MKINLSQSEAPFQSLSTIRRSNIEALQYKRSIERNRITNDNQNINKQTKNTSKITDLRGRLKTADHCGAVLLFELNSLTYAFCSTSQESASHHNANKFENIFINILKSTQKVAKSTKSRWPNYPPIDTEPVVLFELNIFHSTNHVPRGECLHYGAPLRSLLTFQV